jgi:hypothetical protein
MKGCLKAVMFF